MLQSVNIIGWLKLVGGIIAFLGPGFCIVTLLYRNAIKSITHYFILSLVGSVCLWAVLLAWLKLFDIHLNLLAIWIFFLSGWVVGLAYLLFSKKIPQSIKLIVLRSEVLIWIVSIVAGGIVLWGFRHQVAGLGSDSYHHTLITQLIYNNGGLPDSYQPATDQLVSFTYHYGYHATMAALMSLSGWESRLIVLVSSIFLVMISVISSFLLVEEITGHSFAGIIAGSFAGLIFVFPAYMLNWGRYTQFAGLVMLAVFLQMIIALFKTRQSTINIKTISLLALLAAGIALTHYRVTIMAVIAISLLMLFFKSDDKYSLTANLKYIKPLLIIVGLTFVFISPWVWHVLKSYQNGYSLNLSIEPLYYSVQRLDTNVLSYPTNPIALCFIILGLIWGLYKKVWFILWALFWSGLMLILSGPALLADLMDRISVIIALYIPASIIVGWFIDELNLHIRLPYRKILPVVFAIIFIWSGYVVLNKNLIFNSFVSTADLRTADWIKSNIPADALFMVNTYKFGFSQNFIIGIDAGYWLPLLADRSTVTIPMIYHAEKFKEPDGLQRLVDFYDLGGDLTSPDALDYLKKNGVSFVYLGKKGGQIDVNHLLNSRYYTLVYQDDGVYVFKIN